jgi:uncharacterized metal-binding protein (TIGR02443 family)
MTIRKHFIAGARCPRCNAEDKVRFCRDEAREWIECVACGYESEDPGQPEHPNPEPAASADDVGVVRIAPRK